MSLKINTKTRYGLRALFEIALNGSDSGLYQKDISINQEISYKYLDQIIAELKSSGLITLVSGKKSGYRLARNPEEITIYDVYVAFNSDMAMVHCLLDGELCSRNEKCSAREFWEGLNEVIVHHMRSKTINDLLGKHFELEGMQKLS